MDNVTYDAGHAKWYERFREMDHVIYRGMDHAKCQETYPGIVHAKCQGTIPGMDHVMC